MKRRIKISILLTMILVLNSGLTASAMECENDKKVFSDEIENKKERIRQTGASEACIDSLTDQEINRLYMEFGERNIRYAGTAEKYLMKIVRYQHMG